MTLFRRAGVLGVPLYVPLCVLSWVLTVVTAVEAQTVSLKGTVSETVALSIAPVAIDGDVGVSVVNSGRTVEMALSGNGDKVIRVPLVVRSNTGFRISGTVESTTTRVTGLSVIDVHAGRFVSSAAIDNLEITPQFDRRGKSGLSDEAVDLAGPFVVLSGPRISLGGTLTSPNNALHVTLLIRIKSKSVGDWLAHLTFFND